MEDVLRNQTAPLVLAGVADYFPIYRSANSYPYLLSEGITSNPEDQRPNELHEEAWKGVEHYSSTKRRSDASRYRALAGTGRTSNDLAEIAEAAREGRVDVLFATFSFESTREVLGRPHPFPEERLLPGDNQEDLVELCTTQTLLNGGRVHAVDSDVLCRDSSAAAILRY